MPIQPAAQPASSSPPSRLRRRLTALRDILRVLCWTDVRAGQRLRLALQQRFARRGQSPRGARRMAGLRLAAALGSAILLSHAPGMSRAFLLLAFALVGLYGRGILHLGRGDAWGKSVFRASGHDLQALHLASTLKRLRPEALGDEVLRHWRCARRWAWTTVALLAGLAWGLARGVGWILAHRPAHGCLALPWVLGTALGLAMWLPTRYDHHVGLALGLSLDATETAEAAAAARAPPDAAR